MQDKKRKKSLKSLRKWHKWPSLIAGILLVIWSLSGIVLNHRDVFSGWDLERTWMPQEYHYKNWNNASVKGGIPLEGDSLLVYGNIGVWKTGPALSGFTDLNDGFGEGIDNRKVSALLKSPEGNIYAGTYFGLHYFDPGREEWKRISLPVKAERITDIIEKDSKIWVLTRSEVLVSEDQPGSFNPSVRKLPIPADYDDRIGLFKTLWVIHSGEIYGLAGKLVVDAVGIIFIFLTISGVLHFFAPGVIRRRRGRGKDIAAAARFKKGMLNWHNRIGSWTVALLLVTAITGMFLRPPLLIAIADARVGKIPFSVLDDPNPWHDKLRAMRWDVDLGMFLVSTSEGMYMVNEDLKSTPRPAPGSPPVSVMGINVFEKLPNGNYLLGSFSGLFAWDPRTGNSIDVMTGEIHSEASAVGRPVGNYLISGFVDRGKGNILMFDYDRGAIGFDGKASPLPMPVNILEESTMSLWNFALEVHTARFFKFLTGDFYILVIPLLGLWTVVILITGFVVWLKLWIRKRKTTKKPECTRPVPVFVNESRGI